MRATVPSVQLLSSSEEVTLRRVALGIAKTSQLAPRDLSTLKRLALVEIDGTSVRLTALGRQHYNGLPRRVPITDVKTQADYAGLLAKHIASPAAGRSQSTDRRRDAKAPANPGHAGLGNRHR